MKRLTDFLNNSTEKMLELQTLLTSIPALAPESEGQGELKKAQALADWLKKEGFVFLEWFNSPDDRVESGTRPNLVATVPGIDKERTLWIMAHLDVVPTGEKTLWHTDPWSVVQKDGKLYGRGVEDNQQGLVSAVFAALAYLKTEITPYYTIKLLFVADEEVGSTHGIKYLLNNHELFTKNDLVIIPDGGDSKGETIEIAEKNLLWARFKVVGKQAHGSRPDQGLNAHFIGCKLALELNKLNEIFSEKNPIFEPAHSTFEITKKEANVPNVNTIPGEDVFYMDMRILPQYTLSEVEKEINRICDEIKTETKCQISWTKEQAVESPATSEDEPVVKILSKAISSVRGLTPKTVGIGGGTVGAYLRQKGIPAVVWSTLDETAHQPDEYCIIKNMVDDAKVLVCAASTKL